MSRMLSKMNLISVVQQLPKEDIEIIKGYVEMIENENKELKEELKMIEYFYGENSLIKRLKFYTKYIKEKWKNGNNTNIRNNDTSRNNKIHNNSISNPWNNEINNLCNNEKIEKEK